MRLVLQLADVTGDKFNCVYPRTVEVASAQELKEAVAFDHVCAQYRDSYRGNDNFLKSIVTVMDCDNDHSDDPDEWTTFGTLEELFEDVNYAVVTSRHHMKKKDGKSARPRFHVYFQIEETKDAEYYGALKRAVRKKYPFFDGGALDAGRFVFGCVPDEVVWHDGWLSIEDELEIKGQEKEDDAPAGGGPIPEGSRNNTMSRFAGRVLKRYGDTEKAHDAFLEHAKRCDPPLDDGELDTIWGSARRFYNKKVKTQDGYVDPETYNDDFNERSLKPEDLSDIGEAKVLAREYHDELIYTDATDFLRYDGISWKENRQDAVGAVEEFLDLQLVDARDEYGNACHALVDAGLPENVVKSGGKALEKLITPPLEKLYAAYTSAKAYYAFVMKYRNYRNIVNTQNAAKPMLQVRIEDLDAREELLNTPSGTYDLKKGVLGLREHDPLDFITKITNASPGDEGRQLWEDALKLFFCDDAELIDYVQKVCGMAAVGKVYEEALIIAYGEGRNGKSTFWNTVSRVMGTYAGTISADTMTAGCRRNVKPEIAELKGKRLVIAAELEEGMLLSTSILKQLCSTDLVRAEKKYKDPFDFIPSHTVVLYTNHLPKVQATDEGTWRRLILIPFQATIEGKSDIKNYSDYLFNHAAPYIMSWIIEGARMAYGLEFHVPKPKVVADAIAVYRGLNDWLGHFLEECCDIGPGYEEKSGELYQEYHNFCIRTGETYKSIGDFTMTLQKYGYKRKKKKSGMWVQGVQLKDEDFDD